MSTTTAPEWLAEAVNLRDAGSSERVIAEVVGRSRSTVHSGLAKYDAGDWTVNGNGHHPIPGQTTVDEHLPPSEEPAPEDDPEHPDRAGDEFRAEAGEPVGPMPPRPPDEPETIYVEEIRIDGTTQVALDLGGKLAQSAAVSFTGKAVVHGSLRKGDVLRGEFRAVVRGAASKDKVDKQTGIVTEAEERFTAQIVDLVLR